MTFERKLQIALALEQYLRSNNLSQNSAALTLGASAATLSKMRSGAKAEDTEARDRLWDKIDDRMWQRVEMGMPHSTANVLETRQYKAAYVGLMDAKREHMPKIIDGRTGIGKTFCIMQFAKEHPAETFRVRCSRDMSAKSFLQAVARAVGISDQGNSEGIRIAIGEKLLRMNYPLLIIDEAENLRDFAYGSIKALYDDLAEQGKAGIVLVGANGYAESLRRKAKRNYGCFPQIWSRFKADRVILPELELSDVTYVAKSYGIEDRGHIVNLSQECEDYRDLFGTLRAYLRDEEYTS